MPLKLVQQGEQRRESTATSAVVVLVVLDHGQVVFLLTDRFARLGICQDGSRSGRLLE
jgi:hypothetical protein